MRNRSIRSIKKTFLPYSVITFSFFSYTDIFPFWLSLSVRTRRSSLSVSKAPTSVGLVLPLESTGISFRISLCVFECVCVCVYACMCVWMYGYINIYIYIYIYIYVCVYVSTNVFVVSLVT